MRKGCIRTIEGCNAYQASYILDTPLSEVARIEEKNQRRRKFLMTGKLKLEAGGIRDPLMPDEWIYHKDSDYNEVLGFIREDYDLMRQENQRDVRIDSIA